jgi:hypothetical protein
MDVDLRQAAIRELARRELARRKGAAPAQAAAPAEQPVDPRNTGISGFGRALKAGSEGAGAGALFGFDDELTGAVLSPIEATRDWFKGEGFSIPKAYERVRSAVDDRKQSRREQFPKASIAGEIAGSVGSAGTIASKVGTIAGRGILPAAAEGAGYGAVYGAGESKPGERLEGGLKGAAFGAVAGGLTKSIGDQVIKRLPMNKVPPIPAAPTIDDLADDATKLYTAGRATGVAIKPQVFDHLKSNMKLVAGRQNQNLRPKTMGILDDLDNTSPVVGIQEFDELRQSIGQAMKRAEPQDVRTLTLMKEQMDKFADNLTQADVGGNVKGFELFKQAREVYSRKSKAEVIAKLLKDAELDTSQFTQSGAANTITKQFRKLAKNEKALKGFTPEERMLINELAMGGRSSKAMKFLAKFAPRGVVSTILGMSGGMAVGPAGLAVPLAGHLAGKSVDKAARAGVTNLQEAVQRGFVPQNPALIGSMRPFIGPAGSIAGQQSNARR